MSLGIANNAAWNNMESLRRYPPGTRSAEEMLRDELAEVIRVAGTYAETARGARFTADLHDANAKALEPRIAELQDALRLLGATV